MNRRTFLRGAGLATGAAVVGAGAGFAAEAVHADEHDLDSGRAVGPGRPPGLLTTSINYRVATKSPFVALTFDDGPSTKYTDRILDILEDKGVVATYFLIGSHVQALPSLAQRAALTHEIGNHTWSHPNMGSYTAAAATRQLVRTSNEIEAATQHKPTVFRPPYGSFSGATAMIATSLHYPITLWDIEFNQHTETAAQNLARIAGSAGPGSIVLGHDGGTLNCEVVVSALPQLIDRLRDKGLGFVTVSQLLALNTAGSSPPHTT